MRMQIRLRSRRRAPARPTRCSSVFGATRARARLPIAALLSALHGKRVFLFGTCGFGADQSYYQQIIDRVTSNLAGDAELAGWAMCQARWAPRSSSAYEAMLEQDPDNARFKMLLDNWVAAKDHPTKEDLDNMAAARQEGRFGRVDRRSRCRAFNRTNVKASRFSRLFS